MSWLFEDPTTMIVVGVAIEVFLGVALAMTRRGALAYAMAGVALLVAAGVVIEQIVVTPREAVEATLYEITAAVRRNDVEGVAAHLAPPPAEIRADARRALELIRVEEAEISDLKITVGGKSESPAAEARFFGRVKFDDPRGQIPYQMFAANFVVSLRRVDGRWLVFGYSARGLQGGQQRGR